MDKKIEDMEKSIKVIAQYVKEQTEKMREELASKSSEESLVSPEVLQEISELKKRIDQLAAEKSSSPHHLKKLDELEKNVNERLDRIESGKNANMDDKSKKMTASLRNEFDNFRSDVLPKMQFLNDKVSKLHENVESLGSVDMDETSSRLDAMDKKLNETVAGAYRLSDVEKSLAEMKSLLGKVKDFDAKSYKRELEKKISDVQEQFKELETQGFKKLAEQIEQTKDNMKDKSVNVLLLEKRVRGIEDNIAVIRGSIKNAGDTDVRYLEDHVHDLTSKVEEISDKVDHIKVDYPKPQDSHQIREMESKMNDLQKTVQKFENHMEDMVAQFKYLEMQDFGKISGQLRDTKGIIEKQTAEKALYEKRLQKSESVIEDIYKRLGGMEKEYGELADVDMKKLAEMSEHLKGLETHEIKNMASKMKHLEKIEVGDIKKLNETVEQLKEIEVHDIKNLAKRMKDATAALEEDSISRIAFEKRIMDFESKLSYLKSAEVGDIKKLAEEFRSEKELLEKESVNRISVEARVKELESKLTKMDESVDESVEEVEELDVDRVSMEKRLHDAEDELTRMREVVSKIESVEGGDIAKLSTRLQDMEGNMKMTTIRLLTQQLNEFAKSLDRRLPNVVSKEEYSRQIAELNRRMQTIEAPDLSPLGTRVERLEKKVDEIANMMRSMYNRIPIVVE